mmetsp:Transcript_20272/g.36174  ORF Transcript_20272/g.36174 Transcript_20272/m.36174 type:complete len:509 (-) Transcript_20272:53-1579(-)
MSSRQERLEFEANDYYACLNLDVGASEAEVKRHFRQLALVWHPDKHPEGACKQRATDIFQQINKANEVLSDRQQRSRYDACWYQKHSGRHRVVPEWALKAGAGRSSGRASSVESVGSVGSVGSFDDGPLTGFSEASRVRAGSVRRPGSVPPDPFTNAPPTSRAAPSDPGRRFSDSGPARDFQQFSAGASSRPQESPRPQQDASFTGSGAPSRPSGSAGAWDGLRGGSLRASRMQAAREEWARENDRREAEFEAVDKARREKEKQELRKREQARAAEQAEWLKRERARQSEAKRKAKPPSPSPEPPKAKPWEPPPKPKPRKSTMSQEAQDSWIPSWEEEEHTAAPEEKSAMEKERANIEELRVRMAKRAEEIAVKAKISVTSSQSEGSYFFAPEARPTAVPAGPLPSRQKEPFPSDQVRQSSRQSSKEAPSQPPQPVAEEERLGTTWAEEVGNNISSFFANTLSDPSSWFSSRPIRQEAAMPPENCPKCGSRMPNIPGANFCPTCRTAV